jgi:hypothetical protein
MLKSLASVHISLLNLQSHLVARQQDESGKTAVWVALGGLAIVGLTYVALHEPKHQTFNMGPSMTLP